jgi:hypothetical protein
LWAVRLSCPLSVFELELSLSSSELDELDELELLDESDAKPVLVLTLMVSACFANSGSTSCKKMIEMREKSLLYLVEITFKTLSHFFDSFGRPRTVLW